MFAVKEAEAALDYLHTQLPPAFFTDPLSDQTQAILEIPASKKLLPAMFAAAGRPWRKRISF